MEVIDLTEEEAALWIEKVQGIQDEYSENMNSLGLEDALDTVKTLADKYNGIY